MLLLALGLLTVATLLFGGCWLTDAWPTGAPNTVPPPLFLVACFVAFVAVCFLAAWPVYYLGWVWDAHVTARDHPEWRQSPGKCPRCGYPNTLYPWSH
jgi:hypothetical protein